MLEVHRVRIAVQLNQAVVQLGYYPGLELEGEQERRGKIERQMKTEATGPKTKPTRGTAIAMASSLV